MRFSEAFIYAGKDFSTFERHVNAPLFRKSFFVEETVKNAEVTICGLGFYELYINGENITKGYLAPYISNPDDAVYYDSYNLSGLLHRGENVIGVVLGNGMQNAPGGQVWDFHLAKFRGAPRLALCLEGKYENGEDFGFESGESFKSAPSPILFDDLRCGVFYDAALEKKGWSSPGFDDSDWENAQFCEKPRGEAKLCEAEPITKQIEIKPVEIRKATLGEYEESGQVSGIDTQYKPGEKQGFLYDFGVNAAGVCRLKIKGKKGQQIVLQHLEYVKEDGTPSYHNMYFYPDGYSQRDIFYCSGGEDEFVPPFTYHGFRYCMVIGLEENQATEDLLTYYVLNSNLEQRGGFECSNEMLNTLQENAVRSDLANFYYFPTDCPHREKNGWTGDAALSCEQMTLNFAVEKSFEEWLFNIRKAQGKDGSLPGIIPTGGWGFRWGNGPAWDCVLTHLTYCTYLYRGSKKILKDNAHAILRYVDYIGRQRSEDGLVRIGLGDWCTPNRNADHYLSPIEFTDSVMTMWICDMAAFIFNELGLNAQRLFALSLRDEMKSAIREKLIDFSTMTAAGDCQTSQAMAIYYNVFEPAEKQAAFAVLLRQIENEKNHFNCGMLGLRVIFHVLSEFGHGSLAYELITQSSFPSYAFWLERGATSMWESFWEEPGKIDSLNHHFAADISNWFYTKVAGIRVNPRKTDAKETDIRPDFIKQLSFAKAWYNTAGGRVAVEWRRLSENSVQLKAEAAADVCGRIILPPGWKFESGNPVLNHTSQTELKTGEYMAVKL